MTGPEGTREQILGSSPPDPQLVYHYTSAAGLAGMLESQEFWCSSIHTLNDPREALSWTYWWSFLDIVNGKRTITSGPWTPERERFEELARGDSQVACLTLDDLEGYDGGELQWFHRGHLRARNWSHYGDNGRGACIAFRKNDFIETARLGLSGNATLHYGPVEYDDSGVTIPPIDYQQFLSTPEAVASDFARENYHQLFFKKATDWQSEHEFRLLILGDKQKFRLSLAPAIHSIILGYDFPSTERRILPDRLLRAQLPDVGLFWIDWYQDHPSTFEVQDRTWLLDDDRFGHAV